MALENLKSIFAEGAGNNNSQIRDRYSDTSIYPRPEVEAVNFFGPSNSYFPPLSKPIDGFTLNFNNPGYAVGDGFLGDSNLINVTSNFETRRIEINTENLTSNRLGFGEFKSPFENTSTPIDNRFRQGLGFVSETIRSPLGQIAGGVILGDGLLERFTDAVGTAQAGYQIFNSVVNKTFGIDTIQNLIGEIKVEGGTVTVNDTKAPRYEDTVFENTTNFSLGALSQQNPDDTRGIIFQVAGPNGGDKSPSGRPPSSPPRDLQLRDFPSNTFQDAVQGDPLLTIGFQSPLSFEGGGISRISAVDNIVQSVLPGGATFSVNDFVNVDKIKSGFGAPIKTPKFLKDIISFKSNLASQAASIVGEIGGGIISGVGSFLSDVVQGPGSLIPGVGSALLDTADDIFQAATKIDVDFPQIKLRNPFASITTGGSFGGKAKTMGRNPRNLTHEPIGVRKVKKPNQQSENDRLLEEVITTTPYSQLGRTPYAKTSLNPADDFGDQEVVQGSDNFLSFYPNKMGVDGGDFTTRIPMAPGETLRDAYGGATDTVIESSKNGYPLYFQDLRDKRFIIFRGYIEGLTENISPSWNAENYIGRSEPVYTYTRAERDITFGLKLFAQSELELSAIYGKLNQLTSLCYPLYQSPINDNTSLTGKIRMKSPLTKFRLGELFGKENKELLGFIKSINYSYPDNSPWEFRQGQRVPKHIVANISYQVIHDRVPELGTEFYGYLGD